MKEEKIIEFKKLLEKSIQGQGETVAADGGNLVNQPVVDVVQPNFMNGSVYEKTRKMNIENEGITLPRYSPMSATNASYIGSVGYWTDEGFSLTDSNILFDTKTLNLKKVVVNIPATNEIIQDVPALASYINSVGSEALKYQIDRGIIYGESTWGPNGIVGSGKEATIFVTGATITAQASAMRDAYYGGPEGRWYVAQDVETELRNADADSFAINFGSEGEMYLYGYPVEVVPSMKTGDAILADMSQYQVVQKELRRDVSEHFLFDTDQSVFKLVARVNGAPIIGSPIELENGAQVSPFVALAAMEESFSISVLPISAIEGSAFVATVNTVNVPDGESLYWILDSDVTDISSQFDIVSGIFTIASDTATVTLTSVNSGGVDPLEEYTIQLRDDSQFGPILATDTFTVVPSS